MPKEGHDETDILLLQMQHLALYVKTYVCFIVAGGINFT
jgi:hypothetical protein